MLDVVVEFAEKGLTFVAETVGGAIIGFLTLVFTSIMAFGVAAVVFACVTFLLGLVVVIKYCGKYAVKAFRLLWSRVKSE